MKLYGVQEIADALGVPRGTVSQWLKRGQMPEPDARLAMGPAWTAKRIEGWIEARKEGAR